MQVCQAWWCIRRRTSCSTFQGRRLCRCGGVALVSQSRSASIFLCSRSMQSFESQVRFSRPRFWHIWEILQRQVQVSFIKNPLLKSDFSAKKIWDHQFKTTAIFHDLWPLPPYHQHCSKMLMKGIFDPYVLWPFDHRHMRTPLHPKTCWRLKWMVPCNAVKVHSLQFRRENLTSKKCVPVSPGSLEPMGKKPIYIYGLPDQTFSWYKGL